MEISWERIKALFSVLPRLGDTDPYVRIRKLEEQLDAERARRREEERRSRRLEERLELSEHLEADGPIYWRRDDAGNRDRPICGRCLKADEVPIDLIDTGVGVFRCPNCETNIPHDAASDTRKRRRRGIVDRGLDER